MLANRIVCFFSTEIIYHHLNREIMFSPFILLFLFWISSKNNIIFSIFKKCATDNQRKGLERCKWFIPVHGVSAVFLQFPFVLKAIILPSDSNVLNDRVKETQSLFLNSKT